jgi:hypothetical protein
MQITKTPHTSRIHMGASMDPPIRTFHKTKLCEVLHTLWGSCTTEMNKKSNELAWYPHIVEQTYFSKVQIFWKGHKSLAHLPLINLTLLNNVKKELKMSQIFVAFSDYLNFTMKVSKWVWFVGNRIKFFLEWSWKMSVEVVQTISWKKQSPQIANISMKSRAKI